MLKSTGLVRNMDELGRVVLPMELRRVMQIKPGAPIEIFTDGEFIMLRKYDPIPTAIEMVENAIDKVMSEAEVNEEALKKLNESLVILKERAARAGQ